MAESASVECLGVGFDRLGTEAIVHHYNFQKKQSCSLAVHICRIQSLAIPRAERGEAARGGARWGEMGVAAAVCALQSTVNNRSVIVFGSANKQNPF